MNSLSTVKQEMEEMKNSADGLLVRSLTPASTRGDRRAVKGGRTSVGMAERPGTLLELMEVLDHLQQLSITPCVEPGPTLEVMALEACAHHQLPYTDHVVCEAVAYVKHMKSGTLPSAAKGLFVPGWRRPSTLAALKRRQGKTSGWMAFLRRRATLGNGWNNSVHALAWASSAALVMWACHLQPVIAVPGMLLIGLLGSEVGDQLTHAYVQWQNAGLNQARPLPNDLREWRKWPACRDYVRKCLTSAVPMLLEGDVAQIQQLLETSRHEHNNQIQALDDQRQDQILRNLFIPSLPE